MTCWWSARARSIRRAAAAAGGKMGWGQRRMGASENNRRARYYTVTAAGRKAARRRAQGVPVADRRHQIAARVRRDFRREASPMTPFLRRLRYLLRQRKLEADVAEEIETHRLMAEARARANGVTSRDAGAASRRRDGKCHAGCVRRPGPPGLRRGWTAPGRTSRMRCGCSAAPRRSSARWCS